MTYDTEKIQKALREAFTELELDPKNIDDAIFHMVDWLDDLEKWSQFCKNPESLSAEELGDMVMSFLIHVPNHVAAAGKLVTDISVSDIFSVGATSNDKNV
jgi:transcriptional regulator NrdR family protein